MVMTDQWHGQKVIGRHPDITSKLVELVVPLSVESEELHTAKNNSMIILAPRWCIKVHYLTQYLLSAWALSN